MDLHALVKRLSHDSKHSRRNQLKQHFDLIWPHYSELTNQEQDFVLAIRKQLYPPKDNIVSDGAAFWESRILASADEEL